jgi:hypothetical protein
MFGRRVEKQASHLCVPGKIRARTYDPRGAARSPVLRASDNDEYDGLVADDVDHLWGELVKPRATVNSHVSPARRVLAAVAIGELELSEAVLRAGSGR